MSDVDNNAMSDVDNIVVLTGAGISAESGLSTFRDPEGIWAKYDISEVATPQAFAADPELVHNFYNYRRREAQKVSPNAAHYALADLEHEVSARGGSLTLVTQNVDDLHRRAGSNAILQMHGALQKVRCVACADVHQWSDDLSIEVSCPSCGQRGCLRPDIVWFGEMPRFMEEIDEAMSKASLFVSIGTSGAVYPAAGLVSIAKQMGIETCELNLEPSANASIFDRGIYGPAATIVPAFVNEMLDLEPKSVT